MNCYLCGDVFEIVDGSINNKCDLCKKIYCDECIDRHHNRLIICSGEKGCIFCRPKDRNLLINAYRRLIKQIKKKIN